MRDHIYMHLFTESSGFARRAARRHSGLAGSFRALRVDRAVVSLESIRHSKMTSIGEYD